MEKKARVLIDCKDAKGLVYKISKVFYDRDLNIDNNREVWPAQGLIVAIIYNDIKWRMVDLNNP